jgi:hypothetical protein
MTRNATDVNVVAAAPACRPSRPNCFLEANFKNPTKSYFAKKGGGAIYQRHIHYVKASEIEVTRRDLVHAEYSLKKSDCYRQICDIGEPGVVVCRHRSCHQCRHDH